MEVIEIIAANIKGLRKANNMTQTELADKLNYSNKAVSRWEAGEVVPDVITLISICEVFAIPISAIFEENAASYLTAKPHKLTIGNRLAVSLLSIMSVWFAAVTAFVCAKVAKDLSIWQVFVWAVPVSAVVAIIFNSLWGKPMLKHLFTTILLWSLLASLYVSMLSYNLWMIFLTGIPLQIAIILWANITKNNIKKRSKANNNGL